MRRLTATAPSAKATRFDSYQKEVEAVERAKAKNPGQGKSPYKTDKNGNILYKDGKPKPNTDTVVVDDGPEGYGSGVKVGHPVQPTGQQPNATVFFKHNPRTNTWEPLTQYPSDDPVTP